MLSCYYRYIHCTLQWRVYYQLYNSPTSIIWNHHHHPYHHYPYPYPNGNSRCLMNGRKYCCMLRVKRNGHPNHSNYESSRHNWEHRLVFFCGMTYQVVLKEYDNVSEWQFNHVLGLIAWTWSVDSRYLILFTPPLFGTEILLHVGYAPKKLTTYFSKRL